MTQSPTPTTPAKKGFLGLSMSQWILASMLIGVLLGWMFPEADRAAHGNWAATDLNIFATVFLRMIKLLIVPLPVLATKASRPSRVVATQQGAAWPLATDGLTAVARPSSAMS